jgi:hypothetical protein
MLFKLLKPIVQDGAPASTVSEEIGGQHFLQSLYAVLLPEKQLDSALVAMAIWFSSASNFQLQRVTTNWARKPFFS